MTSARGSFPGEKIYWHHFRSIEHSYHVCVHVVGTARMDIFCYTWWLVRLFTWCNIAVEGTINQIVSIRPSCCQWLNRIESFPTHDSRELPGKSLSHYNLMTTVDREDGKLFCSLLTAEIGMRRKRKTIEIQWETFRMEIQSGRRSFCALIEFRRGFSIQLLHYKLCLRDSREGEKNS